MLGSRTRSRLRSGSRLPAGKLALAVCCGVLACGAGCAPEETSHLTLQELNDLEQEATVTEDVSVPRDSLALTEIKPHRVRSGDVLSLRMLGLREDPYASTEVQVRIHPDGSLRLPLVGSLPVAGKTLSDVEGAIVDAYVPDFHRDVSVYAELVAPESTTVVVLGAVTAPGVVTLPQNKRSVVYALATAGGFGTESSGVVRVRPIDPSREGETYDLDDVNDVRRAMTAPPLESGDMVIAEASAPSVVYVTGLVNSPQAVPIPRNRSLTLAQTIGAAGGLVDFLEPDEAILWREVPGTGQVAVKLDLAGMREGRPTDVALLAGDILEVPHTAKTRFRQWFAENIRIGPFGVTAVYDPVADYRARILRDDNDDDSAFRRSIVGGISSGLVDVVLPPPQP